MHNSKRMFLDPFVVPVELRTARFKTLRQALLANQIEIPPHRFSVLR
jgi:hypothetical protein